MSIVATPGNRIILELIKALEIDVDGVTDLVLEIHLNELVKVTITRRTYEIELQKFIEVVKEYDITIGETVEK